MMNMLVMKRFCGSLLLSGAGCAVVTGAALAQSPYGAPPPPGESSGAGGMGTGVDQPPPMPGGMDSGSGVQSPDQAVPPPAGMESGSSGVTPGSGAMSSEALTPDTPGAAGPSDADPYKPSTREKMMSR
ncbi:MAG: hypothetical protein V7606_212 [Burkholderiales bacterium]|jgi:hypothetical protein